MGDETEIDNYSNYLCLGDYTRIDSFRDLIHRKSTKDIHFKGKRNLKTINHQIIVVLRHISGNQRCNIGGYSSDPNNRASTIIVFEKKFHVARLLVTCTINNFKLIEANSEGFLLLQKGNLSNDGF